MKLRSKPHEQVGQKWLTCDLECEHCEERDFCPLTMPDDEGKKYIKKEREEKKNERKKKQKRK